MSTPPRLPDELILEIFRNKSLSTGDLAILCLITRRFLNQVRRSLYESVLVYLAEERQEVHSDSDSDNDSSDRIVYTLRSWQLLRTFQDSPNLAALVDHLHFHFEIVWHRDSVVTGVVASQKVACLTFLRLARRTSKISASRFESNAHLQDAIGKTRKCRERITHLDVDTSQGLAFPSLSTLLPNLLHLKIDSLQPRILDLPIFQGLVSLDIGNSNSILEYTPFLLSARSTLRQLRINLSILIEISGSNDLSDFPALIFLHVYRSGKPAGIDSLTRIEHVLDFWKSICRSTSLRTLSFSGSTYDYYELVLFSHELALTGIKNLNTLNTIRFEGNVPVDRLAAILGWPMFPALRRIVLPTKVREDEAATRQRKILAVSAMCEGTGIEVMLSDD